MACITPAWSSHELSLKDVYSNLIFLLVTQTPKGFQGLERSTKVLFFFVLFCFFFFYCFLAFLACSWFCICAILLVLNCDKLRLICLNGVALVELLNSFDSGSAELAINAYFIVMLMIITRKAAKARFLRSASFLHSFKIVFQDKVNFNNLLTLS